MTGADQAPGGAGTPYGLPAQGAPPGRRRGEAALALLCCLGLAILTTWPLITQLDTAILGHERCTNLMHVWTYWAVHRALQDGDLPILFTYIFYPSGGNLVRLYGSDMLYPPLLAALQPAVEPGTLFNLRVLFSMTLAPFGAYRLSRHLGVGAPAALVGGALFSVTPYFLLESLNGVAELISVEWIPFAVLHLLRTLDTGRSRDAALTALFCVLATWASAYNAFFIAIFALIAVTHRLLRVQDPLITRRHVRAAGIILALGALGMTPLVAMHASGETAASLKARQSTFKAETAAPTADASADLTRFFRPGRNRIPEVFQRTDGGRDEVYTTYTTYMGYVALALALFALWQRRPRLRLWGWSAGIFFLIALGPYLRLMGEPVTVFDHAIPLPSLFLYHHLPGFSVTARHTYRYVTMVHLSLAVLGAFGVQMLIGQARSQLTRRLLPLGILTLYLSEILGMGPAPWPIPRTQLAVPAWYQQLAAEPGTSAIIELPFTRNHLRDLQRYLFFQTVHEKPWIDGAMHFRVRPEALDFVRQAPLAQNFLAEHTIDRPMSDSDQQLSSRLLLKRGYRYVVVHDAFFEDPKDVVRTYTYLTDLYGPPQIPEPGLGVYEIRLDEAMAER